jgi:hypothetical protein
VSRLRGVSGRFEKPEDARSFIEQHELNFVHLCDLLEGYATLLDGSLSWKSPRVSVSIKKRRAAKKVKP